MADTQLVLMQVTDSTLFVVPDWLASEIEAHAKIAVVAGSSEKKDVFVIEKAPWRIHLEGDNAKS